MRLAKMRQALEATIESEDPAVTPAVRTRAMQTLADLFRDDLAREAAEEQEEKALRGMTPAELAEEVAGLSLGLLGAEEAARVRDLDAELEEFRQEIRRQEEGRVARRAEARARELLADSQEVEAAAAERARQMIEEAGVPRGRGAQRALPAPSPPSDRSEAGTSRAAGAQDAPPGIDPARGWGGGEGPRPRLLGAGRADDRVSSERFERMLAERDKEAGT